MKGYLAFGAATVIVAAGLFTVLNPLDRTAGPSFEAENFQKYESAEQFKNHFSSAGASSGFAAQEALTSADSVELQASLAP